MRAHLRCFVILGMSLLALELAPLQAGAAPDESAGSSDEALYAARLARITGQGVDAYDSMEPVPGAAHVSPLPVANRPTLPAGVLSEARAYALANNSKALLIWRDGKLEESVYAPGSGAATLLNSRSMAKPLSAVAVGRAIERGLIKSLDQSAADFIVEWRGTPKAAITIRELLSMTAGLAEQGQVKDPASIMTRAYLSPRHLEVMINEYPLTAEPGTRYQYSNVSGDLIAVVIERATRRRYAAFVSEAVLKPLGAAGGEVWVDRPGGLAHSGCCILLPAETWMRLGLLIMGDGVWEHRRLLPKGYVEAMKTPTASNPRYGLGLWLQGEYVPRRGFGRPDQMLGAVLHSEPYVARDLFLFDGNANQVLYMIPSRKIAILRMGDAPPKSPEWDNAFLPNLVLRALAGG
jgi:CubicO group peptidase (beta-lactamase class C family)